MLVTLPEGTAAKEQQKLSGPVEVLEATSHEYVLGTFGLELSCPGRFSNAWYSSTNTLAPNVRRSDSCCQETTHRKAMILFSFDKAP